jgi:hypothetical protein
VLVLMGEGYQGDLVVEVEWRLAEVAGVGRRDAQELVVVVLGVSVTIPAPPWASLSVPTLA